MTLRMPVTRLNAFQRATSQLRLARRSLMDARLPPEIEDAVLHKLTALMTELVALEVQPDSKVGEVNLSEIAMNPTLKEGDTVNEVPTLEGTS